MENKRNIPVKKIILSIFAFGLPFVIFQAAFRFPGVTQKYFTILTSDLNGQYIDYFYYFYDAIHQGKGLFYSFSMALGSDTFSLFGYYLLSPLNLLVLLYPAGHLSSAIYLIITLKISLAGLFCFYFFARKNDFSPSALLFSTTYALSGYIFSFFMNLMWLDSVYMLPLVIIGLEVLFEKGRIWLYCLTLTLSIVFCYYTGYMLGGFGLIYVVYLFIIGKCPKGYSLKVAGKYIGASLLSLGMSAGILFPTLLSQFSNTREQVQASLSDVQILPKFFTGATNYADFEQGFPQIYCGIFILFLSILYFLSFHISMRKKLGALLLVSSFLLSFHIESFNLIWHGFSNPNDFLFRYSFIFTFVLVLLAEEMLSKRAPSDVLPALFSAGIVLVIVYFYHDNPLLKGSYLIFDIVFLLLMSFLFIISTHSDNIDKAIYCFFLAGLQFIQLFFNAQSFVTIHTYDDFSNDGFYREFSNVIEELQPGNTSFYRIEKNFYNSFNDAMLLSYPSVTHFSSAWDSSMGKPLQNLGYSSDQKSWIYYGRGGSLALDSLLGLKYIITKKPDTIDLLPQVSSYEKYAVYENPYVLPIGFLTSERVLDVQLKEYDRNPFINQHKLYNAILGKDSSLFTVCPYDFSIKNLSEKDDFYEKISDEESYVSLQFKAYDSNPVYLYLPAEYYPGLNIAVNGAAKGECMTVYDHGIIPLGVFHPGETVEVVLTPENGYAQFHTPLLYSLNLNNLSNITSNLQRKGLQITARDNDSISAKITALGNENYVTTTIPYDPNWQIKVDNQIVPTEKALSMFIAFPISPGEHQIKMKYHVQGLVPSILISVLAILLYIFLCIREWRRRHDTAYLVLESGTNNALVTNDSGSLDIVASDAVPTCTCQQCGKSIATSDIKWINLFGAKSSVDISERFPHWDKLLLCKDCAEIFQTNALQIPGLLHAIEEESLFDEEFYQFDVVILDDIDCDVDTLPKEPMHIVYTAAQLEKTSKAYALATWEESLSDEFLF